MRASTMALACVLAALVMEGDLAVRVLVACERSGVVRDAFRKRGHDAWSCDLAPAEDNSKYHVQGDVLWDFNSWMAGTWDLLIAHPPCTYLSSSGLHWNKRRPERAVEAEAALSFALKLWALPFSKACMENPVGRLTNLMRRRCELIQAIQPYQFGHDASKKTCLILRNLPKLRETKFIEPRMVCCGNVLPEGVGKSGCPNCEGENTARPRWANQTDSGQNKLGPSDTRAMDRARTYQGIANAMAAQWGGRFLDE